MYHRLFIPCYICCILMILGWASFSTASPLQARVAAPWPVQDTPSTRTTVASETLTILYWQAPSLANPYLTGGTKERDAAAPVLEPLANYNEAGELVPRLAVSIPASTTGGIAADGLAITWTLHSDVRWADDTPLTADDVVFTWEYCTDPETGCVAFREFENVAEVTAVNDLQVRLTFTEPTTYPYIPFVTADMPILQRAQFADCMGSAAQTCSTQNNAPVGTGPFRITEFKVNDTVFYERNPLYRGNAPYFDQVIIKGGGDSAATARAVLETREADYAWNLQVEPQILAEMEAKGFGRTIA